MSVISRRFADELAEKKMRDAYLSGQTRTKLTNQIRAIRNQRGWLQGEFAKILGKPQSNVSRLENREYGNFTLNTLLELASAFDVGLVVEFVPYDDFLRRTHDLSTTHLQVRSFSKSALEPLCRDVIAANQMGTSTIAIAAPPMPLEVLGMGLGSSQSLSLAWHDIGTPALAESNNIVVGPVQGSATEKFSPRQTDEVNATRPLPPQIQASPNQTFIAQEESLAVAAE
jgi:transcriptional regulator with XRE-family HTH domain